MTTIVNTPTIWEIYMRRYKHEPISAAALFFHSSLNRYAKGLRVLLPYLDLEFADNSYIGTDPAGYFYCDDLNTAKTANRYVSDNTRNPSDGQLIARVKFYNDNTLVAEFIAEDPFNAVSVAGMVNYEHSVYWQKSSSQSYVEAYLEKDADSSSVTLDISKAIGKKATMTTNDPELIAASISHIKGRFHYDSLANISNGQWVSYTNDRLVFFQSNNTVTGITFTGFFIPDGRSDPNLLGISDNTEITLAGIKWD